MPELGWFFEVPSGHPADLHNVASTEPQDHAHKIKHPTLYIVNENDPFVALPDVQRKVFERMGANAEFQVVSQAPGEELGDQLNKGIDAHIEWLRRVLK